MAELIGLPYPPAVGETALKHFLTVKRHELATYETHVHPWERETYLEIV